MKTERQLIAQLNGFIVQAQQALRDYLPPDSGKSDRETIAELLGILDSRELINLQKQVAEKPALFNSQDSTSR